MLNPSLIEQLIEKNPLDLSQAQKVDLVCSIEKPCCILEKFDRSTLMLDVLNSQASMVKKVNLLCSLNFKIKDIINQLLNSEDFDKENTRRALNYLNAMQIAELKQGLELMEVQVIAENQKLELL